MSIPSGTIVQHLVDDVFNGRNWDAFDNLHDPDGPIHRGGEVATPAEIKALHQERLKAFPDLWWTVERQIENGDIVVTHATWRGTHYGTYLGIQATGRVVNGEVIAIRKIAAGRVVETWAVADTLRVLDQISRQGTAVS